MRIEPVVERYDTIVRDIQSNLVVVGAGERMAGSKTPVVVKAIWDTGAYGSVISPKVAQELGLVPVGVKPANGTYEAYAYVVDMMLPNKLTAEQRSDTERGQARSLRSETKSGLRKESHVC